MSGWLQDRKTTNILLVVLAGLILILVLVLVVFNDDGPSTLAGPGSTPTATAPGSPSPSPSVTGSKKAAPEASAKGAILRAAKDPDERALIGHDCQESFVEPGYELQACNGYSMAGGAVQVIVQSSNIDEGKLEWLVHLRRHLPSADVWALVLEARSTKNWVDVSSVSGDVTDSGSHNVFVAYRTGGSGRLDYDALSWPKGRKDPYVRFHRSGLIQGSLVLSKGKIEDYGADLSDGSPECCPRRFAYTRIEFEDGAFRITKRKKVDPDEVKESHV